MSAGYYNNPEHEQRKLDYLRYARSRNPIAAAIRKKLYPNQRTFWN